VTRAVWIAAIVGALVGLLLHPRGRRALVPIAIGGAVLVLTALLLVPGLGDKASSRASDEKPIWDRKNTDATAARIIEQNPLVGVGWYRFTAVNVDYARQADAYPLSQPYIGVHNVFLSYAAELGLPAALLWVSAVALGGAAAWRGSTRLAPEWRAATIAILVNWLVVVNFDPLGYAFPNLCVWVWLGLAAAPTARRALPVRQSGGASRDDDCAGTHPAPAARTVSPSA
jgi:putative inorganic carbon (hco3(-)) transporter